MSDFYEQLAMISEGIEAAHRTGIGGSGASVVMGYNRWKTPLDYWAEFRGTADSMPARPEEKGPMYWGTRLEPVVLQDYAMDVELPVLGRDRDGAVVTFWPNGGIEPWRVETVGEDDPRRERWLLLRALLGEVGPEKVEPLRHPDYPWMICLVDGVPYDPETLEPLRIAEGKTTNAWKAKEWGEDGTDELPDEYLWQGTHNIEVVRGVTGIALPCDVPVLIGGQDWRILKIERDDELAEILVDAERAFWDSVAGGEPPSAERNEAGAKALAKLYSRDDASTKDVSTDPDFVELGLQLGEVRELISTEEKRKTALEVEIKERMGETAIVACALWKISWKRSKDRQITDWEALAAELAAIAGLEPEKVEELVEKYTETRPGSRRFLFRSLGG